MDPPSSGCWRIICQKESKKWKVVIIGQFIIIIVLLTFCAWETKASCFYILGCVVSAAVGTFQSYKVEFHCWLLKKKNERTKKVYAIRPNLTRVQCNRCKTVVPIWYMGKTSWKLTFKYLYSLWSNHYKIYLQCCSHVILERVDFVLVYRGNPIVWSYRSLMFDKLDTRNDPMPAEL